MKQRPGERRFPDPATAARFRPWFLGPPISNDETVDLVVLSAGELPEVNDVGLAFTICSAFVHEPIVLRKFTRRD
jgi:hypothetical protein